MQFIEITIKKIGLKATSVTNMSCKFIIISILGILVYVLNSCATVYSPPAQISLNKQDSLNGVALFSISNTEALLTNYQISIFNNDLRKIFFLNKWVNDIDLKKDSAQISYSAILLPKGSYRVIGWEMSYQDLYVKKVYFSRGNFSIPFTIHAGRVNYLGDYLAAVTYDTKILGARVQTGVYYVVSDRFEEDFGAISKKFPQLDINKVLQCIPDFAGYNKSYSGMYLKGVNIP
ncbi:hypothetical protein [Dyadobacter aurulentus]|uniref:hypothetical protein n=1 Tax=Dyadobacter sp. UC 10 TaxID=2605428 RepID=UPI0011F0AEEC|nr:hypothetical protein [Dyadobacter sp. UC 10]KAA0991681.1 hypothetical protein FXO21_16635 [Dyadobacter sp. UC 10]